VPRGKRPKNRNALNPQKQTSIRRCQGGGKKKKKSSRKRFDQGKRILEIRLGCAHTDEAKSGDRLHGKVITKVLGVQRQQGIDTGCPARKEAISLRAERGGTFKCAVQGREGTKKKGGGG